MCYYGNVIWMIILVAAEMNSLNFFSFMFSFSTNEMCAWNPFPRAKEQNKLYEIVICWYIDVYVCILDF